MNIIIKTTPTFDKQTSKLLSKKAVEELYDYLLSEHEKGTVIPGTSGVRKIRWYTGENNKGKSGGVRILYHYSKEILILLITTYSKSDKENITFEEKNTIISTKIYGAIMTKLEQSSLGKVLLEAVDEALNHESNGRIVRPEIDLREVRKKLGMSQLEFAKTYHLNLKTLRQWEQNKRFPDAASIAYLECIFKAPEQIKNILTN